MHCIDGYYQKQTKPRNTANELAVTNLIGQQMRLATRFSLCECQRPHSQRLLPSVLLGLTGCLLLACVALALFCFLALYQLCVNVRRARRQRGALLLM